MLNSTEDHLIASGQDWWSLQASVGLYLLRGMPISHNNPYLRLMLSPFTFWHETLSLCGIELLFGILTSSVLFQLSGHLSWSVSFTFPWKWAGEMGISLSFRWALRVTTWVAELNSREKWGQNPVYFSVLIVLLGLLSQGPGRSRLPTLPPSRPPKRQNSSV